jgi:uroporphyrinogen decarboxylase
METKETKTAIRTEAIRTERKPDFGQLERVLRREIPDRPVLFEFFFDDPIYELYAGEKFPEGCIWPRLDDLDNRGRIIAKAFAAAGYDHVTIRGSAWDVFHNIIREQRNAETVSLNEGEHIWDRASFEAFPWCDPDSFDDSHLDRLAREIPEGMKLIVHGPMGIEEIVFQLTGYERLCYLLFDKPDLVEDIFRKVGEQFVSYYRRAVQHESVGAIIYNDDWGFNTGPMISPEDLRRLVFPHVRKIVQMAHDAGKPAILHSCGNLYGEIMEDIIEDLKFDAKHSYEDLIMPVEEAYQLLKGRIAVLGGLDVDYLVRHSGEEIEKRAAALVEMGMKGGGYALGSGNSIAKYIPDESFQAMRRAAGVI